MTPPLPDPVLHETPFRYVTSDAAVDAATGASLRALFDADLPWVRHDSFYQCWMADVTDRVDAGLRRALAGRLAPLLGVPLTERVTVTAQRMEPGDQALPHTDRPLVGYESARLVLQLNEGWTDEDGGAFVVHPDAAGEVATRARLPRDRSAVAFVMTTSSHHRVLPSRRVRRTLVFHFWHAGNTPALEAHVAALLGDVDLRALPAALDPVAAAAEATRPEEDTWRALLAAWALHRWGYGADAVVAGYRAALGEGVEDAPAALAAWVARLRTGDFDVAAWTSLAARLPALPGVDDPRLAATRALAFPPGVSG